MSILNRTWGNQLQRDLGGASRRPTDNASTNNFKCTISYNNVISFSIFLYFQFSNYFMKAGSSISSPSFHPRRDGGDMMLAEIYIQAQHTKPFNFFLFLFFCSLFCDFYGNCSLIMYHVPISGLTVGFPIVVRFITAIKVRPPIGGVKSWCM